MQRQADQHENLLEGAARAAGIARDRADWGERNARLHPDVVAAMVEAGVPRLYFPRGPGGYEAVCMHAARLQLAHANVFPKLLEQSPTDAYRTLSSGGLIHPEAATSLIGTASLYRELRSLWDAAQWDVAVEPNADFARALAHAGGRNTFEELQLKGLAAVLGVRIKSVDEPHAAALEGEQERLQERRLFVALRDEAARALIEIIVEAGRQGVRHQRAHVDRSRA